jgi:hypothetical protein
MTLHQIGRCFTIAAVSVSTFVAAPAAFATTPQAAGLFTTFNADGVRIRAAASDTSGIRGLGYRGQGFCVDGRSGNWNHGQDTATGVVGWVYYSYLKDGVSEC